MTWRVFIALCIIVLVSHKLKWENTPTLLHFESMGFANLEAISLGDLCDSSILAGLRATDNVANASATSLIFATTNKLLKNKIDLFDLQRIINIIIFSFAVIFVYLTLERLNIHPALLIFFMIYYCLSSQFLSHLFTLMLSLTTVAWLAVLVYMFIYLLQLYNRPSTLIESKYDTRATYTKYCVLAFIPVWLCFSYETYAVSRIYALVSLLTIPLYLFYIQKNSGGKILPLFYIYFGAFLISSVIIKLLHPDVQLNLSIFNARGEAVNNSHDIHQIIELLGKRLNEMKFVLLEFPRYNFIAESVENIGWLDFLITLGVLILLNLIFFKKIRLTKPFKIYCFTISFLTLILIAAFCAPLLSSTFVRGHRLIGFYYATALIAVMLIQLIIEISPRYFKNFLAGLFILASITTVYFRVPVILSFDPYTHPDLIDTQHIAHQLTELKPSVRSFKARSTHLKICDKTPMPLYPIAWGPALYASDLACHLGTQSIETTCYCQPGELSSDLQLTTICLTRETSAGGSQFKIRAP